MTNSNSERKVTWGGKGWTRVTRVMTGVVTHHRSESALHFLLSNKRTENSSLFPSVVKTILVIGSPSPKALSKILTQNTFLNRCWYMLCKFHQQFYPKMFAHSCQRTLPQEKQNNQGSRPEGRHGLENCNIETLKLMTTCQSQLPDMMATLRMAGNCSDPLVSSKSSRNLK